jgi:beta-glucuronidase
MRHLLVLTAAAALAAPAVALADDDAPGAGSSTSGARPAQVVSTPSPNVLYEDGHAGRRLIDGTWLFRTDFADEGVSQGFARQESTDGWSEIQVPHAWNATDVSSESQRGSVVWYRKDFQAPSGGPSWRFRFESVNHRATVYLNGRRLGSHEGAYVPFEVDARGLRRGVNRLVIRVDNRTNRDDLPPGKERSDGTPGGGWWNYGGLLREVYMRPVGRVDVEELQVLPRLPCRSCDAVLSVRAVLRNKGRGRVRARPFASIEGHRARFRGVTLRGGQRRAVTGRAKVENPRLWEPGDPELYAVNAGVGAGGRRMGTWSTHVGIRSIKVSRSGRVLVNGEPIQLRGAAFHEDHPTVGAAFGPAERLELFGLLEELNATMTRSHYPVHPHFLELADRAGMMVWDEIPFYQVPDEMVQRRSVRRKGLRYMDDTIARDSNHPSVIVWSIGNELGSRPSSAQRAYIRDAARLIHRRDRSRLAGMAITGYPSVPRQSAYNPLDALGVNTYFGWYPGPNGQVEEKDDLGPYLDRLHGDYRRKALFVTEFGAEGNRHGPIDEKGTYEYQTFILQHDIAEYDARPFVNGATTWILRDFKVRPDWDGGNPKPVAPWNQKGLVDQFGEKKPAFDVVRRMYGDVDPLP